MPKLIRRLWRVARGADKLGAETLQAIPIESLRQACQRAGGWSPVVAPPVFPDGVSPIEGVRKGLAGTVAVMSGTNRDENNLFMARMTNTPSREELEQRVAEILSGELGHCAGRVTELHDCMPRCIYTGPVGGALDYVIRGQVATMSSQVCRARSPPSRPDAWWPRLRPSPRAGGHRSRETQKECSSKS
jgi:carboxylesterase type B